VLTDTEQPLSPRLEEFQREVEDLKVTGGKANPERAWMIVGALAMIVGVVLGLVGWLGTRCTESTLDFADFAAMSRFGIALTIAGSALFTVMSLRRWFRFWLVRLIYEMRDQADRATSAAQR
jgi:hypothetical protein